MLYFAENGVVMVLWVGQQLPPEHIQKLFGVPSLAQIQAENMVRVHNIVCGAWWSNG